MFDDTEDGEPDYNGIYSLGRDEMIFDPQIKRVNTEGVEMFSREENYVRYLGMFLSEKKKRDFQFNVFAPKEFDDDIDDDFDFWNFNGRVKVASEGNVFKIRIHMEVNCMYDKDSTNEENDNHSIYGIPEFKGEIYLEISKDDYRLLHYEDINLLNNWSKFYINEPENRKFYSGNRFIGAYSKLIEIENDEIRAINLLLRGVFIGLTQKPSKDFKLKKRQKYEI